MLHVEKTNADGVGLSGSAFASHYLFDSFLFSFRHEPDQIARAVKKNNYLFLSPILEFCLHQSPVGGKFRRGRGRGGRHRCGID